MCVGVEEDQMGREKRERNPKTADTELKMSPGVCACGWGSAAMETAVAAAAAAAGARRIGEDVGWGPQRRTSGGRAMQVVRENGILSVPLPPPPPLPPDLKPRSAAAAEASAASGRR